MVFESSVIREKGVQRLKIGIWIWICELLDVFQCPNLKVIMKFDYLSSYLNKIENTKPFVGEDPNLTKH